MRKSYGSVTRLSLDLLSDMLGLPENVHIVNVKKDSRDIVTIELFSTEQVEGITYPVYPGQERYSINLPLEKEDES